MITSAKTVKVTAQIGNVSVPVNTLTLRHTINALPTVEFTTQLSNHGAAGNTGIDLDEFRKLNVLVQEKFYNHFSLSPDTIIQVTDGDGNTITFNGFLMQPQLRIVSGQVSLAFSAVHVGVIFQSFNGSIYNTQPVPYLASSFGQYFAGTDTEDGGTQSLGPPGLLSQLSRMPAITASEEDWSVFFEETDQDDTLFLDGAPTKRTDSIAHRIFAIVRGLHEQAVQATANQTPEIQDILNTAVLSANTAVLPYIKHFLMGSLRTTIISGLTAMGTDPSDGIPSDSPLLHTLFDILTDSPNFLAALLNYINPFLFQLNATWDGKLAFEPNQFIQPPGDRLIKAPISDNTFTLAGAHELPLAQVIVLYPTEDFYVYGGNMGADQVPIALLGDAMQNNPGADVVPQNFDARTLFGIVTGFENLSFLGDTMRYLAKYPTQPNVKAGQYLTVMAPAWTCPTSYTGRDLLNGNTENRFNAALGNVVRASTNLNDLHVSRVPILNYIAKTTYESVVLSRSNMFLSIPLCLAVQVGRTYNISDMDEQILGQGYLRGVTHTIVVADTGGTAMTSLDFSHVISEGAELIGVNTPNPDIVQDVQPSKVSNLP